MRNTTLIRRNLFRHPMRLILLMTVCVVAFVLFGVLVTVQTSLSASNAGAAERLVVSNKVSFTQPLPAACIERLRGSGLVRDLSYTSWFGGYFDVPDNFLAVFAVEPSSYLRLYPELGLTPQAKARFLAERDTMIIGKSVADRFGWNVGDRVSISSNIFMHRDGRNRWPLTVAGIYENLDKASADQAIYIHHGYLNDTRRFFGDKIGSLIVKPAAALSPTVAARQIDALFENTDDETRTVTELQFTAEFIEQFGNIRLIVLAVVGAGMASILLIFGNAMLASVRARGRELAVMRALGFSRSRLAALLLMEAVTVTGLGALLGLGISRAVVGVLSSTPTFAALDMGASVWMAGLLVALGLGAIVAALPIEHARSLSVADVLSKV